MKIIKTFEEFLYENEENLSSIIDEINDSIKDNLDPYDSIAGGECYDIVAGVFYFCKENDFLKNPKIMIGSDVSHAWVQGLYMDQEVILDIVAINQTNLGEPFKLVKDEINNKNYKIMKEFSDLKTYFSSNRQRINIGEDEVAYIANELMFLLEFI